MTKRHSPAMSEGYGRNAMAKDHGQALIQTMTLKTMAQDHGPRPRMLIMAKSARLYPKVFNRDHGPKAC